MLRTIKPKSARAKRVLAKREPKVIENTKQALFIRGSNASHLVTTALRDLYALKKPDGIIFSRKNSILPFESSAISSIEFFAQKNDTSLMVIGTHQKKRPHNLVFIRLFDNQILDMIEIGIEKMKSIAEFSKSPSLGMKPLFVFTGTLFESDSTYKHFKSIILDMYRGQEMKQINLAGLEYVICVTSPDEEETGEKKYEKMVYFRVYHVNLKKSGQRTPRVELEEIGPSYDFKLRRVQTAQEDMLKSALRIPKELQLKNKKNVDIDPMGDKLGRIHVGRQDLSKLQTRKMKGLKKRRGDDDEATLVGEEEEGDDENESEHSDEVDENKKRKRSK